MHRRRGVGENAQRPEAEWAEEHAPDDAAAGTGRAGIVEPLSEAALAAPAPALLARIIHEEQ
jgi:hypothetical protein